MPIAFTIAALVFQILTFATIIVATVGLWLQKRALNRQRLIQQTTLRRAELPTLIQHLESPPVRAARHIVREKLSNKRFADWTENEQTAAAEALAAFDIAGSVARLHEIDSDVLLDHWAHDIAAICRTCREYIAHRRAQEGHSYLQSLLWLEAEVNKVLAEEFATPSLTIAHPQPLAA